MPWEVDGENIMFSGAISGLMALVMEPYELNDEVFSQVSPGTYATAAAVVLRELYIDALAEESGAQQFVAELASFVREDDGGVTVETFQILDAIAENIEPDALQELLETDEVHTTIAELALEGFEDPDPTE